jgi:DNA polymerase-3 subunit delta
VDYGAFLTAAERRALPPTVLIHGPDAQLLDDALGIVSRVLFSEPSAAAFDREVFDGQDVTVEVVTNAALTLPVLAATRLVVVRRAQALTARDADALRRWVAAPNPAACLLLLADETLTPHRDRKAPHWLLDVVPALGVVALVARRGRPLEEWLRQRAQAEGLAVSEEAARLLVQHVGEDSATLLGEVQKAALAGGPDNRAVGVKEVSAVVGEHRVSGLFDLTRAVERHELGLALRTLDRLLATEDPLPVLVALTRDLRMRWTVREWRERGRPAAEIARVVGRPPAVVDALLTSVAGESSGGLAAKLERCWIAERRLKSGGEPNAELAALVAALCRGGDR